jgi:hypothetical protein
MKIAFGLVYAPEDPEKAILPALVWCSARHPYFNTPMRGGSLSLGWWHYGVRIAVLWSAA